MRLFNVKLLKIIDTVLFICSFHQRSITSNSNQNFPNVKNNLQSNNSLSKQANNYSNKNIHLNQIQHTMPQAMPNLDFNSEEQGESIKVCVRIRPMNMTEQARGDSKCVDYQNSSTISFKNKSMHRNYQYNISYGEGSSQEDIFYGCSINVNKIITYLLIYLHIKRN